MRAASTVGSSVRRRCCNTAAVHREQSSWHLNASPAPISMTIGFSSYKIFVLLLLLGCSRLLFAAMTSNVKQFSDDDDMLDRCRPPSHLLMTNVLTSMY